MSTQTSIRNPLNIIVIVAALGYFVDIYDLILFSVIRNASLAGIGVPASDFLDKGGLLLNWQMSGMLVGGLLWGILGDKKGRLSVLFGSITLYSVANICNGFVTDMTQYAVCRFIAGVGLAGELGAGITLVVETMSKESRAYGTMLVSSIGILGAVIAALVGDTFKWQTAYFVGGGMGILLLILRLGVFESGMYKTLKEKNISKGNFFSLFSSPKKTLKYLSIILIGLPIWYVIGILITFCPEIVKDMGAAFEPKTAYAVMYSYIGLSVGGLISGYLSNVMKSRKKASLLFILLTVLFSGAYFLVGASSVEMFYLVCLLLGIATGYWAVFITLASEQFGTNIRATVTTTAPNFVRGALVLQIAGFKAWKEELGVTGSAIAIGVATLALAIMAVSKLEETYNKDLDYVEL